MVTVRRASREDMDRIVHFNAAMALETESLGLDTLRLKAGVEAVFEDAQKGFYLVALVKGQVQSCLMVTREWSDWRNGWFWWIQSVFVDKQYRQLGLYKSMYAYLQKKAHEDKEVVGIRLYVEKENQIAQNTYEKLGMYETDYLLYETKKI